MNNKTKNKETNKLINLIILIDHTHLFITHTYTLATRLYIALLCLATLLHYAHIYIHV